MCLTIDSAVSDDYCTFFFFQIHIQTMLEMDSVRLRWKEKKGRAPTADDAERIYQKSLAATLDVLPNNSHVISGQDLSH